jgi:hypothetical protein
LCAPRKKFIVELDGSQHLEQEGYDKARTDYLESQGYKMIRFWNDDVMKTPESVILAIKLTLGEGSWSGSQRSMFCAILTGYCAIRLDASMCRGVTMRLYQWSWALGLLSYVALGVVRRSATTLAETSLGNVGSGIVLLSILLAVGGIVLGVMSLNRKEGRPWWVAGAIVLNIATVLTGILLLFF